jgi:hypothetical protein
MAVARLPITLAALLLAGCVDKPADELIVSDPLRPVPIPLAVVHGHDGLRLIPIAFGDPFILPTGMECLRENVR